jgi:hypothetical protein
MKAQLASIGVTALQMLSPVLVALMALATKKLHTWIDSKIKNEQVRGILDRLDDTAMTVVQEVEQTVVSKLDPSQPLGTNAVNAKNAAIASLKTHLGQKGLDEAKQVLGIGDSDLEKVIVSFIEAKVHVVNQAQGKPLAAALQLPPIRTADASQK